jgi:tetratricopeptide (TPR) repeat protein
VRALALVLLLGATARAADDADAIADARAREHFARGTRHFNLGEFDAALGEFRAAYSLSQAPALLFNMAQACRASRQHDLAIYYYRAYLRAVPDAPEAAYVEERLRELAERPPPPAAPSAVAPPPPTPDDAGRGKRVIGAASAITGAALVATAVWFGVRAGDAADDVSDAFARGATYDDGLAERYAEGRRAERVALITGTAGVALAAGGAVLWYLGVRDARAARVAVVPSATGATVAVGWSW